ncbi:unnamed protein product [Lactuca saligna]|uniref:PHD-type domain-containing protein n=1 Tax=Lactuca saligna TaxID=75948 RepID=A0AA36EQ01_LACSI|nr:unnamed protein product [Lactuca saligna]
MDQSEVRPNSLGEKRPLEEGVKSDLCNKKVRVCGEVRQRVNVKKVAEIVLVLATIGKLRAGRNPTPVFVLQSCQFLRNYYIQNKRWKNMRCSHYTLLLHMLLELFHQIKQITHPIHLQDCIIIQQFFMLPQFQIRELYHINCPLAVILEGILPSLRSGRPHLRSDEIFNYHRAPITHKEISKFVEKILQAQITEQQKWTPPSRDYMNKPLTCQTCKTTITKVDTTLVCDACEKGYHLKCLHYIPKSFSSDKWQDWHCVKCLSITNGKRKALPPKYGPVITS